MPVTADIADQLAEVALDLAVRIRDEDPAANARWLRARLPNPDDWFQLAFVLAAAIPDDRPWHELTAWVGEPPKPATDMHDRLDRPALRPCGTRAAYRRHRRRGEEPCQPCKDAAAEYRRDSNLKQRHDLQAARSAA